MKPTLESKVPVSVIRDAVSYNPEVGSFEWLERPLSHFHSESYQRRFNAHKAGTPAFTSLTSDGYLRAVINYNRILAHRAAWALHYGDWPDGFIDHINHDTRDNRIANLRVVSSQINSQNKRRSSLNKSGVSGVTYLKPRQRWLAKIGARGSRRILGYFNTFEEAVAARKIAEFEAGYHPNHGQ